MAPGVEFEENQAFGPIPEPVLEPDTFGDIFVRTGIAHTRRSGTILLLLCAVLLFSVSAYILASAVPPPHQLGNDILAPGETIPSYVK